MTSDTNFRRIFPNRKRGEIEIGPDPARRLRRDSRREIAREVVRRRVGSIVPARDRVERFPSTENAMMALLLERWARMRRGAPGGS